MVLTLVADFWSLHAQRVVQAVKSVVKTAEKIVFALRARVIGVSRL